MSLSARAESFWKAFLDEMRPAKLAPSLITSSIVAMMTVVLSVSFVALIFVDPITGFSGEGTNLMLVTAVVVAVSMAIFSSYAGTIAIPQDRVAPIVALMATLIIQEMRDTATPEQIGLTVLASIAVGAVFVGLVLFILGVYKLGNVVRFIPYPVIGGFLAGSGWLLLAGSFKVVTGQSFSLLAIGHLYVTGELLDWLPCAAFGTIAYLAVRFSRHYLTLPAIVFSSLVLFYVWIWFAHHSFEDARLHRWILGAPPNAGFAQIRTLPTLALEHVSWGAIFHQYTSLGALALTSIVSILLNTTALELAADEDIDLNKELRAAGLANLMAGTSGGMVGFQSLSLSSLPISMGVRSRLVGLLSALVCLLLLCFGTQLLGYIPRFILGGILFYNGLAFLTEWVIDAYFRLIREDYLLVVLILAIVAVAGYLQGVASGILVATVLFVVKYSTVNVITNIFSGDGHHSTVDRSPAESRLLNTKGGQVYILRLKGFIFFGSANNILNTIRERQAAPDQPKLRYAILDFQHVSGLDTSGLVSMSKLSRLAAKENFLILAAAVPVDIQNNFRGVGLLNDGPNSVRLHRDRDHAVEWCENEIIREELVETEVESKSLPDILHQAHPWRIDAHALLEYAERFQVEKNYYLILQGDPSSELFFIETGKVKVVVELDNGRTMRVRTMGPGTVVGEIGLYLDQPRVASVVTEEACVFSRFTVEALRRMEQEQPVLASAFHEFMVRVLAERVTQQNRTLRALVD